MKIVIIFSIVGTIIGTVIGMPIPERVHYGAIVGALAGLVIGVIAGSAEDMPGYNKEVTETRTGTAGIIVIAILAMGAFFILMGIIPGK